MRFGGYYVTVLREDKPALLCGPFKDWQAAENQLDAVKRYGYANYPNFADYAFMDKWGVGYFAFPELVLGKFNKQLWINPHTEPLS